MTYGSNELDDQVTVIDPPLVTTPDIALRVMRAEAKGATSKRTLRKIVSH